MDKGNTPHITVTPSGVILVTRVTPNAGSNAIDGVEQRDNGQAVLRIRVTAVPDKGKANKAVIALLAKHLHIAKSAISITSGETARQKKFLIRGDSAELVAALDSF